MSNDRISEVRKKYGVPEHYARGWETPAGLIHFDWCDSTITVHPDGTATETHMGLGVVSHEFITTEWKAGA